MLKPIIKDRDQASNIYKGRFEAADDNGRTKITDEAWNDATAAWPASARRVERSLEISTHSTGSGDMPKDHGGGRGGKKPFPSLSFPVVRPLRRSTTS